MKVKPRVPGDVVRFPTDPKRVLKAEGEEVPDGDMHWTRRLRDGSVVLVEDRAESPTGREPIAPLTTR